ncbi:G-type lectin S-receptor-like serine/threonine-protein kinase At1g11410 [Juglans microcarpa x Juglans regia]|uniref:G-type lectin S-receptor-like serine/threonine-protein kinase At1g11410 n=1 Tax=Juglans microcarpa x Juglans regia TaxID=2249226 RepID=UPI001B7F0BF2|nr:G-type lectin S-receptor-like serine/threonine-protein kinase At1g11410 [Juglans microcarpa x Juglans regia]
MNSDKLLKILILIFLFFFLFSSSSTEILIQNQSIKDGQTLISKEKNFFIGFFSPANSSYRYLGIWFAKVKEQTLVWVANRNDPFNDSSGILSINQDGNLILHDSFNHSLWSTNISVQGQASTTAQLLDSGNLVLVQENNKKVLWQSFDYPTDTLLPNMSLGLNQRTGLNKFLTSWKSRDDPGTGDCIYKLNLIEAPQFFLYKGSIPYWRTGPWPWRFSAIKSNLTVNYINNGDEISYKYFFDDSTIITRIVLDNSGLLQQFVWNDGEHRWKEFWSAPKYRCDKYGQCGAYSICNPDDIDFECSCLPGYEPKSPRQWYLREGSELGCVRKKSGLSMCGNGEGFVKMEHVKAPFSPVAGHMYLNMMSYEVCKQACLRNCSCTAFTSLKDEKETNCLHWYGELMDIKVHYDERDPSVYVRVDAADLAKNTRKFEDFLGNKGRLALVVMSIVVPLLPVILLAHLWLRKKKKMRVKRTLHNQLLNFTGTKGSLEGNELENSNTNPGQLIFDLSCIVAATDNFSPSNKLGQGGFGPVFKGQLPNGQYIAVKRLSKNSGQGIEEFKNEVELIAKLQHRNLVKMIGCCIQGEEKMLIYEYMSNKSLNFFVFDPIRSSSLNWSKRFEIIIGIARGILYLHHDSRLRIIHRDLKTSNILLDDEMNPKISDFGVARIFKADQIQDRTNRVVGTYGYMSPEYAVFGKFSTKSDVFSFGVILLEIISGKKNSGSYMKHHSLTLIGQVWELWTEDRALDIVDSSINESYVAHEVLRSIQIGLLCVQEDVRDRPDMLEVLLMLYSDATTLPSPKQPAFIFRTTSNDLKSVAEGPCSINGVTLTNVEAR